MLGLIALFLNLSLLNANATEFQSSAFSEVADLPIQNGGRLKPLESFSQDLTIFVTGKKKWQNYDPIQLILSWTTEPELWMDRQFVGINRPDVRRQLLVEESRRYFSPKELFKNVELLQYAQTLGSPNSATLVAGGTQIQSDPRITEIRRVLDRLTVFQSLAMGDAWTLVPSSDLSQPWTSVLEDQSELKKYYQDWVTAYRDRDLALFKASGQKLKEAIQARTLNFSEESSKIRLEVIYQRGNPFQWAWIGYLIAFLAFALATQKSVSEKIRSYVSVLGWFCLIPGIVAHIFGFVARTMISGRAPVTNMYESVVWVSLGTVFFTLIIWGVQKQRSALLLSVGSAVGALALIAANAAPAVMDPSIHPLVPVLRSNFWLTIHVLTITLSYAAFALSAGLSNVTLYEFFKATPKVSKIENLNQLSYRGMQFGVILLAAGTILGGVWADYSWGRFWGWDPKETWALIALLCYLALLHARFIGWINAFTFPVWTVLSFLSVVMAWYGVNFVLGVGLHSYGFSSGGFSGVMLGSAIQVAFVVLVVVRRRVRMMEA